MMLLHKLSNKCFEIDKAKESIKQETVVYAIDYDLVKMFKYHINMYGIEITSFCIKNRLIEENFRRFLDAYRWFNSPSSRKAIYNLVSYTSVQKCILMAKQITQIFLYFVYLKNINFDIQIILI